MTEMMALLDVIVPSSLPSNLPILKCVGSYKDTNKVQRMFFIAVMTQSMALMLMEYPSLTGEILASTSGPMLVATQLVKMP